MEYYFSRRELVGSPLKPTTKPSTKTHYIELKKVRPTMSPANLLGAPVWAKRVFSTSSSNNVLIVVHGFNVQPNSFMGEVADIRKRLKSIGYSGAVVGYDWPSDGRTLHYKQDWNDARLTAKHLVSDGIATLLRANPAAKIHILAHSMGAFVTAKSISEALNDSGLRRLTRNIGEVVLTAPDLAAASANQGGWVRDVARLGSKGMTGFISDRDLVLTFSRDFRNPASPRLGRNHPADNASSDFAVVNCSQYYTKRNPGLSKPRHSHSWYYGDSNFYRDLSEVLKGRTPSITRKQRSDGHFTFKAVGS